MNRTDFDNIGETLYAERLENGLRVLVVPRRDFRRAFALFATDYGGADRRFCLDGVRQDTPAGVAHFLEHKMFDLPDGSNALSLFSARGASPNAFTGSGMTAYHFSCTEGFDENLRLLLRFVSTPYFTAESVAKEQGIIGQEIRMCEDNPDFAVYYGLLGALYARHPIRESVAGTAESIAQITPETLYACHRAFYRPSNMALCCVGDLDPDRIADLARELLPPERGEVPGRDYGEAESLAAAAAGWSRSMAVSAPQFFLGAKAALAPAGEARLRQKLTAELALSFLVGESSPFYTRLYGDGLLNRDFSFEFSTAAGTATAVLGGESREPERVREALGERVRTAAESGFDGARFERVKKALYGQYLRALESFESLAGSLASDCFDGYRPQDVFGVLPELTAAECAAFAAETLAPERLALAVVSPGT